MLAKALGAPIVTEEMERAERAAMTEAEKKRYHAEIYGKEEEMKETPEMIQNGLALLQDALDSLAHEDKQDFQEALERVPELVATESPHISFLRACRYDAWAAARRLVDYWSSRRHAFGEDRAFLPMTLQGAMAEDVQYLEKALLFGMPEDAHHRAVLFCDSSRCTNDVIPRESLARCLFYVLQAFGENELYQIRGYVIVSNNRSYSLNKHWDRKLAKCVLPVHNSMPVQMKAIHFCTGPGATVLSDLILPMLKYMAGKDMRQRFQLHSGYAADILLRFQDFGLGEAHVQAVYGGEAVNRVTLRAWLEERRQMEEAPRR